MFCKIYRWFIACGIDDGRQPGRLTARHIGRCTGCRKYYKKHSMIDAELTRGKAFCNPPDPADCHRIMESLPDVEEKVATGVLTRPPLRRRTAVSAALFLLLAAGALTLHLLSERRPRPAVPIPSPDVIESKFRTVLALNEILTHHSLEREMEGMKTDILAAAGFLMDHAGVSIIDE